MIQLSLRNYFTAVVLPCIIVTVLSFFLSIVCKRFMPDGIVYTIFECMICALLVAIFSYFFGLNKGERSFINGKISVVYNRLFKHD